MLENAKLTRATYKVPKGEEKDVHYVVEAIAHNPVTGAKISKPRLVKTPIKLFDQIKRVLELQGNTINILYHPLGKYNPEPKEDTDVSLELKAKEAEIEALKAKLKEMTEGEDKKEEKKVDETSAKEEITKKSRKGRA